MSTVTYDAIGQPKVTLTKGDGYFEAVIEVDGLDAKRGINADERALGIRTLTPPTVRVRIKKDIRAAHRALITASQRAVAGAATSTTGNTGGPAALLFTHGRVAMAIRNALRKLGEDI